MLKTFGSGEARPDASPSSRVDRRRDEARRASRRRSTAAAEANPGARTSSFFTTGSTRVRVERPPHRRSRRSIRRARPASARRRRADAQARKALPRRSPGGDRPRHRPRRRSIAGVEQQRAVRASSARRSSAASARWSSCSSSSGRCPAVAMPLLTAVASILNTFTLVWVLTYITERVDHRPVPDRARRARRRDRLRAADDLPLPRRAASRRVRPRTRSSTTMQHAGRSVIVSGSTVAVGLLSMVILPLPFIRSIGIGGMLIPAVSVLAAITLLPAMLAHARAAHQPRARDAEAASSRAADPRTGFWIRWARLVTPPRAADRPAIGLVIVRRCSSLRPPAQPERGAGRRICRAAATRSPAATALDDGRHLGRASTSRSRCSSRARVDAGEARSRS